MSHGKSKRQSELKAKCGETSLSFAQCTTLQTAARTQRSQLQLCHHGEGKKSAEAAQTFTARTFGFFHGISDLCWLHTVKAEQHFVQSAEVDFKNIPISGLSVRSQCGTKRFTIIDQPTSGSSHKGYMEEKPHHLQPRSCYRHDCEAAEAAAELFIRLKLVSRRQLPPPHQLLEMDRFVSCRRKEKKERALIVLWFDGTLRRFGAPPLSFSATRGSAPEETPLKKVGQAKHRNLKEASSSSISLKSLNWHFSKIVSVFFAENRVRTIWSHLVKPWGAWWKRLSGLSKFSLKWK